MSKNGFLIDSVTLGILGILQEKREVRYFEMRKELQVSDSLLNVRLRKLKSYRLIEPLAKTDESGRSYFTYVLTTTGQNVVKKINPEQLLDAVESIPL
jgi:predicted transcriptional regulator